MVLQYFQPKIEISSWEHKSCLAVSINDFIYSKWNLSALICTSADAMILGRVGLPGCEFVSFVPSCSCRSIFFFFFQLSCHEEWLYNWWLMQLLNLTKVYNRRLMKHHDSWSTMTHTSQFYGWRSQVVNMAKERSEISISIDMIDLKHLCQLRPFGNILQPFNIWVNGDEWWYLIFTNLVW